MYERGDIIAGIYEVYSTLGEGGFGLVYLAYRHDTREVAALKTFRDEFLADGKARDAFKKEALLWVNLEEHPFILPALGVMEVSGRLFVIMDYIAPDQHRRVNLTDHLEHVGGPIDTETALRWAIQFCYGMEHVNVHGVKCHRDIKPTNILITQDGTLKITDFGLAAAAEIAREGGVSFVTSGKGVRPGYSLLATEGKHICGTPGYIPPEIHRGEGADVRSDIYSFGLVLWQMASGSVSPPFHVYVERRGSEEEYIRQYLEAIYRQQMTGKVPFVDSPMKTIIERCLTIEPSKRYTDFTQLRDQLASVYYSLTCRSVEVPPVGDKTSAFWSNKGASLNALGQYEEAILCFDKAIDINPRDAAAYHNKGNSLQGLGRLGEALVCYDRVLSIEPSIAWTWNSKAIILENLGRREEAILCYDKALEINAQDFRTWSNKGILLDTLGRHEEAIVCFERALEIDPHNQPSWYGKGNALRRLGRLNEAISSYDRAIEIDPLDAAVWNAKGTVLADLDRTVEALPLYEKAIEIDPTSDLVWSNKGKALCRLGRHEEGISCCDRALKLNPKNAITWINKGATLAALGRLQEGLKCFDRAIDIDPRLEGAWCAKGDALNDLGRFKEALECHDRALQLDPQYAVAWRSRGDTLQSLNQFHQAIKSYERSLEINASDPVAWYRKGRALWATSNKEDNPASRLEQLKEVAACFKKALDINPRYVGAWISLGNWFGGLDYLQQAKNCFEAALELDPQSVAALTSMAKAHHELGDEQAAVDCYNKVLGIDPRYAEAWYRKALAEEKLNRKHEAASSYRKFIECAPAQNTQHIAHARRRLQELER